MTDDLVDRLNRAQSTPYGKARSALLEDVVRRADAVGDLDLAFFARLALVQAYVMGGEPRKSLVPFARCVADWDADPGRYQQHSHNFLWCFKFAPNTLTKFPEVPLEQTYAVLDDMERRWRIGGHSMHAVHQYRWQVAAHLGDAAAAEEQFRLWSTAPRDDLSDCVGCDPTQKAQHLIATGRSADAVALAVGVLDGQLTCNEQPQQMLTALLPAFVAEGMYSEAVDAHRRAYRILRGQPGELSSYADHVLFCARTGNETRAVELIERHLPELDDPPTPIAAMEFAAAAALVLGKVDLPIRRAGATVPSRQLAAVLTDQAIELAELFDKRNGTDHQSTRVRRRLTAEPWVEYLPLSETARRAQQRTQQAPSSQPAPAPLPEATGRGWLERAEEAWQTDQRDEAIAAWEAFEREVPESEWSTLDRARALDGMGMRSMEQPEVAVSHWAEAIPLYDSLGEEIRVLRDRARIGRLRCEQGRIEEGLAIGESALRRLVAEDEPRRRAGWHYSLALILYRAERVEEALRELEELRAPGAVEPAIGTVAALLHASILIQLNRLEEAEAAASPALGATEDLPRSLVYRQLGWIRLALDRPAEAVEDLEEAVALAVSTPGAEQHLALCRLELSRAYLQVGRPLDSAETAEEALAGTDVPDLRSELRSVLLQAYRALGELEPALAQAQALIAAAPEDADPAALGMLRQEEGSILERLDRDEEAIPVFLAAADFYLAAESPLDHVQSLRLAGQSARYTGNFSLVRELAERCTAVLDALPSAEQGVLFQRAGVHWDLAMADIQQGELEAAVAQARQAAEHYERGGYVPHLVNARLVIAEHGTTDDQMLREILEELEPQSDQWYRAGYLLVDRLRLLNRGSEADALEAQLSG